YSDGATVAQIEDHVSLLVKNARPSSVRSYLRLNTPRLFARESRGTYTLAVDSPPVDQSKANGQWETERIKDCSLVHADCFDWLQRQPVNCIHAVVTDPPYGLFEYSDEQQRKLRAGKGGVWRIPPSFDGAKRSPLPRFTTLTGEDLSKLDAFFFQWTKMLLPVLVPGANVLVASNPLLSYIVSGALARAGLERRGEIIRLVMTMRGGDRPKDAHEEFSDVSVMPRSMWEPWLVFRKPLDGRAQDNLRKWKTGGFRRPTADRPFGDVIQSSPTGKAERILAPHPSLKPQEFLRTIVRGVLPLGEGTILDPFAGSGSTLAAASAVGYKSIGIEKDKAYFEVALRAIPKLMAYRSHSKLRLPNTPNLL
ncbi:MAG: DNA methyltransferase, partial [Thermoflexales bacterium]